MLLSLDNDARRQYIDASTVFNAYMKARQEAKEVRGGMYWKPGGQTEYLIRTSVNNTQKSLGPRSPETEAIYAKFQAHKAQTEGRVSDLKSELTKMQRLNKALGVGRTPPIVVSILNAIEDAGLAEYFTVVGTHALYAYESAAGVRIMDSGALATRDVDLLWDTRKRMRFISDLKATERSMIAVLQRVDSTFRVREDQRYSAQNSTGFEVDILRREQVENDPHPIRLSDDEDDLYVVPAKRASALLNAKRFATVVVATNGQMARMTTVEPMAFSDFKQWLATESGRDTLKRDRDRLQADLVKGIVEEHLPQWATDQTADED